MAEKKKVIKKRTELHFQGKVHPLTTQEEEEVQALAEEAERRAWLDEQGIILLPEGQKVSQVELDLHVDTLLGHARQLLNQYLRNRAVYEQRREELDEWYRNVQRPLERGLTWMDALINPLIRLFNMGGKKSRVLPNGKVGGRAVQPRVEITDSEAAVKFCKKHALEIKEEPYKKPIMAWINKNRNKVKQLEAAGIMLVEGGERTYWEVPEHKVLKGKAEYDAGGEGGEDETPAGRAGGADPA